MKPCWVIDTSTYTHFCQAGHGDLIGRLAPGRVLVPDLVSGEIDVRRAIHPDIPSVQETSWAELAVIAVEEQLTLLGVKARLGGAPTQHLGECAVIACAQHRGCVAVLDEREAIVEAHRRGVETVDSLWLVIEAYRTTLQRDRAAAEQLVDDLIAHGLWLPVQSGAQLFAWAWREGLLP